MHIIFAFVLGTLFVVAIVHLFLTTPAADLARNLRRFGGIVLIVAAIGLAITRQFGLAVPLAVTGYMLWRRDAPMQRMGRGGGTSSVRSEGLAMALDHDTGEMDGEILKGRHAGGRLSELDRPALYEVAEDFRGDAESLRLLESYLDRAHPGWRDDVEHGHAGRSGPSPGAFGMSAQEAYEILGIEPGAGEAEIREAHRRLMKQVHPDRGGSAALAARINEAKDRLLKEHR